MPGPPRRKGLFFPCKINSSAKRVALLLRIERRVFRRRPFKTSAQRRYNPVPRLESPPSSGASRRIVVTQSVEVQVDVAGQLELMTTLEIDERQPRARVDREIPERSKYRIPRIVRDMKQAISDSSTLPVAKTGGSSSGS
jgi:hypothetical protein